MGYAFFDAQCSGSEAALEACARQPMSADTGGQCTSGRAAGVRCGRQVRVDEAYNVFLVSVADGAEQLAQVAANSNEELQRTADLLCTFAGHTRAAVWWSVRDSSRTQACFIADNFHCPSADVGSPFACSSAQRQADSWACANTVTFLKLACTNMQLVGDGPVAPRPFEGNVAVRAGAQWLARE